MMWYREMRASYIGVRVTFMSPAQEERADRVNIPIRGCLSGAHIILTIPDTEHIAQ